MCALMLYICSYTSRPDTCTGEPKEGVSEKPQHRLLIGIRVPQVRGGVEVISYVLWLQHGAWW